MLDLNFYTIENETFQIEVSESIYENLAHAGLNAVVNYSEHNLIIEGENYKIYASKLNFENRLKLLLLVENERQNELEKIFKTLDEEPTLKEVREHFKYISTLTTLYSQFKNEKNAYFSYE
ncbi:hypothetical protein [Exiguobacterium sp. JLM-2]|uniref:hypothetical protein n=1 Tax=Exiguobacterium sp. JLM-2 TaxID=1647415 RepID=UPI000649AA91|nr:hypothetical protein [Exiguobacterium sp. JLM-2]